MKGFARISNFHAALAKPRQHAGAVRAIASATKVRWNSTSVHESNIQEIMGLIQSRSRFPGAPKSPLVTHMDFLTPSALHIIPSYHVMNAEGGLQDTSREEPDVTDEEVLTWYKNMLTGEILYNLPDIKKFSTDNGTKLISWTRSCSRHKDTVD